EFDRLKELYFEPYMSTRFRSSHDEMNWLVQKIESGEDVSEEELNEDRLALFATLEATILSDEAGEQFYEWDEEQIDQVKTSLEGVRGEMGKDTRDSILKSSRQYAIVQFTAERKQSRGLATLRATWENKEVIALGLGALWAARLSRD